jgi:hypothetical protein
MAAKIAIRLSLQEELRASEVCTTAYPENHSRCGMMYRGVRLVFPRLFTQDIAGNRASCRDRRTYREHI